ncbi:hypothetical protein Ae201684P_016285 [Aphanomyces euteiches]|uniref:Uncharacterized protein n=1 Tax=Aphanomyces euteiches TaxID=100861 RepID=A0A6G0XII2_9STRA|nr:hypothetical protein Ae201684_004536 [Aphanomyces euteiches]KAH9093659.1 hypothetical protein Ae201684P_016285 [Aphanomyces euteiches]
MSASLRDHSKVMQDQPELDDDDIVSHGVLIDLSFDAGDTAYQVNSLGIENGTTGCAVNQGNPQFPSIKSLLLPSAASRIPFSIAQ